jgi:hypothetical protein
MDKMQPDRQKKTRARLTTLSSIRKELARVYEEARSTGADPAAVQYYRALTFILTSTASVQKDESLGEITKRLDALEQQLVKGQKDVTVEPWKTWQSMPEENQNEQA